MRNYALRSTVLLAALLLAGCATTRLSKAPVSEAVTLDGWDGVNNLYRDGAFYFGGQPDEASLVRLARQEGVRTVISIRAPEEMERLDFDEKEVVENLGMRYVNIPVSPDLFSGQDVDDFSEVLEGVGGSVLLHCGSSNRVGGVWAAYLHRHRGIPLEEAIEKGKAAGLSRESMIEAVRRVANEQ